MLFLYLDVSRNFVVSSLQVNFTITILLVYGAVTAGHLDSW